ncbi:hypothetical protein cypCar_00026338 [Cyprinus carpio]|nr:hypothetical protein cypCar_00026338 [Cyprinus carpio]
MALKNLILILVATSLSWTSAMVMAKFALFTRIALQQWAALYQPLTFHGDSHSDTAGEPLLNKLDPAIAFRGKAKPPTPKKKQAAQVPVSGGSTAKAQGVSGKHSVTKR